MPEQPRAHGFADASARSESEAKKRKNRSPNAPPVGSGSGKEQTPAPLSDCVYDALRSQILTLRLVPGTPISENAIAQAQGISRTPVREAILRLADENLVEVVPKSGTFVGRIPLSSLPEALIARRALEAVAVRSASRLATPDDIARLIASVEEQRALARQGDVVAHLRHDDAFHAMIAAIGGLPGLWTLVAHIKVQIDRFRCLTLAKAGHMSVVADEHAAIVAGIAAHDEDRACAEMEAHLRYLRRMFPVGLRDFPQYFIDDVDLGSIPDV